MAEEGIVIGCHNPDQWKEQLEKHKGTQKLVVVDFTASWCGPCRVIAPILADFAKKMPHVTFLKVDVDEVETVAQEYLVEAMPTFLFFKNGEVIDKIVGAKKDDLHACIVKHAGAAATVVVDFTASCCGPYRLIAPFLADIAKKMPHVTFLKVDVDEVRSVAEEYQVETMPTFLFIKNGEVVVGARIEDIRMCITKHEAAATVSA